MRIAGVLLLAVGCSSAPAASAVPPAPAPVAVVDAAPAIDAPPDEAALKAEAEAWKERLRVVPADQASATDERTAAAAFLAYADVLDPADDERPRLRFLAASIYRRLDDATLALPIFEALVRDSPTHEVALYAANLLLDLLNRAERYDEMLAWVDTMRGMPELLEGRDDLREVVDSLHLQKLRKDAEAQEQAGDFAACAATYLAIHAEDEDLLPDDEILFDALMCFHAAGDDAGTTAAMKELARKHAKSPLTERARELRKQWKRDAAP